MGNMMMVMMVMVMNMIMVMMVVLAMMVLAMMVADLEGVCTRGKLVPLLPHLHQRHFHNLFQWVASSAYLHALTILRHHQRDRPDHHHDH